MDAVTLKLREGLLALSVEQRAFLAQELWTSLGHNSDGDECDALAEAQRREKEMADGTVKGRTHEEVMATMRQKFNLE